MTARYYAYAGDRRVHYRRAGSGSPLVLLHAAPGSSFTLEPILPTLAERHTVIALDLPGYGESGPIGDRPSIPDFAEAIRENVDALGLGRFDLFGSHTGSKVAIAFAARYPDRVRRLVLEGVGLYTADELADLRAHFTPSIQPEWDGTHLVRAWNMRRDMHVFWPWHNRTPAGRRTAAMLSAEALHDHYVDFLRAGPGYGRAFHASFNHGGLAGLRDVGAPTLLIATASDVLRDHLDRAGTAPAGVTVEPLPDSSTAMADRIVAFLADDPLPAPPPPPVVASVPGVVRRTYADTRIGQVLVRRSGDGPRRPIVLFHASPGSSAGIEPLILALGADRPVIAFDTPGNGDSTQMPYEPVIGDYAAVLGDAIAAFGLEEFDVYGAHTGALIAMEVAIARNVRHAILDGITLFSDEVQADRLAKYSPPMRITSDGGHILWTWHFRRDMMLYSPWFRRTANAVRRGSIPTPQQLHDGFVELIKAGSTYHYAYRAAFSYPTRNRLPRVPAKILHCTGPVDSLREGLAEAGRLSPGSIVRVTQGMSTPEDRAATVDLYRRFLADQPMDE